jgi:regulator of replication initiation timing
MNPLGNIIKEYALMCFRDELEKIREENDNLRQQIKEMQQRLKSPQVDDDDDDQQPSPLKQSRLQQHH